MSISAGVAKTAYTCDIEYNRTMSMTRDCARYTTSLLHSSILQQLQHYSFPPCHFELSLSVEDRVVYLVQRVRELNTISPKCDAGWEVSLVLEWNWLTHVWTVQRLPHSNRYPVRGENALEWIWMRTRSCSTTGVFNAIKIMPNLTS